MTWDDAKRSANPSELSDLVGQFLEHTGEGQDLPHFLHYSSDISPDACERAIVLKRRRARKRPLQVGERLRMEGGNRVERMVVEAWAKAGKLRAHQVPVRALRPSAWAWTGKADVILTDNRLVEIKGVASYAFRGLENPASLLSTSHQWQASAYFDALSVSHGVESASVFYVDREGAGGTLEIPLKPGELLVPSSAISDMEDRRSRLLELPELPPVPEREVEITVWKGKPKRVDARKVRGRFVSADGRLPRTTKADGSSSWALCQYCQFRGVSCDPGSDVIPVEVSEHELESIVEEAERRWGAGEDRPFARTIRGASIVPARPHHDSTSSVDDSIAGGVTTESRTTKSSPDTCGSEHTDRSLPATKSTTSTASGQTTCSPISNSSDPKIIVGNTLEKTGVTDSSAIPTDDPSASVPSAAHGSRCSNSNAPEASVATATTPPVDRNTTLPAEPLTWLCGVRGGSPVDLLNPDLDSLPLPEPRPETQTAPAGDSGPCADPIADALRGLSGGGDAW